jgi:hypothetical protein
MALIGYTPGGSPIFFGGSRGPKPNKNVRFRCKSCDHKTTKNQLKANGGKCWHCKRPINVGG